MTTTAAPRRTAAAANPPSGRAPRALRRRWLRLAVPYALVTILVTITAVAYAIEEPDPTDRTFLAPASTAGLGGSKLAERLRQRGVTVERVARTPDALISAHRGRATLFIPAPDLLHAHYLRMLKLMPATTTVVLVRPSGHALDRGLLPAGVRDETWTARTVPPACAHPVATAAGPATALRTSYVGETSLVTDRCYAGGLVRTRFSGTTLTLVGATEPFRNDRIDEPGNAALAVGLLATAPRVVWLDTHRAEPGPAFDNRTGLDESPAPASLGPGSPDPDFPVYDPGGTGPGQPRPGEGDSPGGAAGSNEPGLHDLFPAAAWTVLALALLAALLAAFARSRRLGAPVPEPLPVLVPSTETVTGRGRLYQRSQDRGAALAVLRVAARAKLARLLDQPSDASREELAAAVADHTGDPTEDIDDLLYGRSPTDDAALVTAAAALEALVAAVTRVPERKHRQREE